METLPAIQLLWGLAACAGSGPHAIQEILRDGLLALGSARLASPGRFSAAVLGQAAAIVEHPDFLAAWAEAQAGQSESLRALAQNLPASAAPESEHEVRAFGA